ncbi:MAG TPA: carboxypeptidase-like regulatory domain-containing protein [Silvibacterium sp.]|nr:carboxypeptidase-like regulatory domain-containing protein [Silvibacterium sp.]
MKFKIALLAAAVVAAFCLIPSAAHAQNVYAAIHGTVTDSSGAVVPNASVTVLNTSTGITTTGATDSRGYYTLPQLQIGGPYTVTIAASGFKSFTQSGLTLNLNDNRDVDARLEVGTGSTTVQVSATALQVETSDTQIKQVMTAEQLEEIPLAGRDPAGLQKLQPGVVESSDRFGNFSTDGSQTPQNAYLVNGVDINDGPLQSEGIQVNPDALQEENIIVSTLNPEFSRNSGAIINQVVKAGTNHFHGNAFEFYRDTFLNSTPYFAPALPEFHQNLYGATLGGPVIKDKLFFFLGYQGFHQRTGVANNSPTMTEANFAGDFSDDQNFANGGTNATSGLTTNPVPFAIPGTSCAPPMTWADCFPSGSVTIAPANWNPVAANATAMFIPHPNFQGNSFNFNTADNAASDQGIIRADFTPTSRDTIWASTIFQSEPFFQTLSFGGGTFPGFPAVQTEHFKVFSGAYTHTFSPNTLNELRAGYYRFNFLAVQPAHPALPSSFGFTGINPQNTAAPGFPNITIGFFALGNSFEGPQPRLDSNLSYGDNFTKIIGNHSLKFGASYEQFRVDNPFAFDNNGNFGFGGAGPFSSGDPILDWELGIPDSYLQTSNGQINVLSQEAYAYGQDSWKVSPDLTVNYGLAWDVEYPTTNAQDGGLGINCWTNSSFESTVFPGGAPPGLAWPGDPGCNRAGGPTPHYNRFGPRVGVAWSPSSGPSMLFGQAGSHEFSIRLGYGLYYNRDQEEQSLQNLEDPPFFTASRGVGDAGGSPSLADPFTDVSGAGSIPNKFPFAIPHAGDTNIDWADNFSFQELATFAPNYSVPYTQNFNLNIQRSLPSNMLLQIGYVGSVGHRLASWFDGNQITQAGHNDCLADPVCSSAGVRSSIREFFPQFAADPAIVPGSGGGVVPGLPNGIPWYLTVARQTTEGSSNYNSLQVSLIKARTHGLYATVSYTYSHSLDDGSGYESFTGTGPLNHVGHVQIFTPGFTFLNYGDSDFDARHRIVGSYVYAIPVFSAISNNAVLREAIAGWELSGVTALQSGFPISFSEGQDRSLWCDQFSYFGCGDVPVTSSFHLHKEDPRKIQTFEVNGIAQTGNFFFDPSSFSDEPVGTFGNTKRNFFHGPGFDYTNLRLSKNFLLGSSESRYIQLGIEAFNAFNHANFDNPSGNFSNSTNFGETKSVISSADPNNDPQPARTYQLVGKIYF